MALSFNGLQPVAFGGKDCTPRLDAETKLRLQGIKTYDQSANEALAAAFPDDEEYVKEFLTNSMTVFEKELLHAYLLGGEKMVGLMMDKISNIGGENGN